MISGLNQEVDILGKVFHFQTELSEGAELAVRTEVFVGGKIVATRDAQLKVAAADAGDEEKIRSAMKEHHSRVLKTFVERARRYNEREQEGILEEKAVETAVSTAPVPSVPEPSGSTPMPGAAATSVHLDPPRPGEAMDALRARRLFGQFRHQLGLEPMSDSSNISDRIDLAAEGFAWMVQSPTFDKIRVDEQVRCHLLKERIDQWISAGRDIGMAAKIWSGIVAFVGYLTEINDRIELISFDQQMLVWAIDVVQQHGMSDDILERLGLLYGRDPNFDRLLDEPQELSRGAWAGQLRRVLTRL